MAEETIFEMNPASPLTGFFLDAEGGATKPTAVGEYVEFKTTAATSRSECSLNSGSAGQKMSEGEYVLEDYYLTIFEWGYQGTEHCTATQMKGLNSGGGSPQVEIEIGNFGSKGNGMYVTLHAGNEGGTEEKIKVMTQAEIEGTELHMQNFIRVSKKKEGTWVLKVNGVTKYEKTNYSTLQEISEYGFWKFGIYKGSTPAACRCKVRKYKLIQNPAAEEEEEKAATVEAVTKAATAVSTGSVTLHGEVNPGGKAGVGWYRYGTDSTLTSYKVTEDKSCGSGAVKAAFEQSVTGLEPNTTYYFKQGVEQVSDATQKTFGSILSFKTEAGTPVRAAKKGGFLRSSKLIVPTRHT